MVTVFPGLLFKLLLSTVPFLFKIPTLLTVFPIILTRPLAALFSVDSYASFTSDNNQKHLKRPFQRKETKHFLLLFNLNDCDICTTS